MKLLLALTLCAALSIPGRDVGADVCAAVRSVPDAPKEAALQAATKPAAKTAARLLAALEETKWPYEKSGEGLWTITFKGKYTDLQVALQALDEMVVISSTIVKAPTLDLETLRALMKASFDANFSKIAMDAEGNIVALTELPANFANSALRDATNVVLSLADDGLRVIGMTIWEQAIRDMPPTVPAGQGSTVPILGGVFELSYDPAKWKRDSKVDEIQLVHVSGEAYLTILGNRTKMTQDGLRGLVIKHATSPDRSVSLLTETPRTVNGLDVTVMRYNVTTSGAKLTFCNQIYADASGNVQLAGWAGASLFDKYERDFLELFAGFRKVR